MSCNSDTPNINKTFIIDTISSSDVLSACTAMHTNFITQCTGDTVTFSDNISATTYYGDGSQLSGVVWTGNTSASCVNDIYVSNLYGCSPITVHTDIEPNTDNTINLGTPVKRFRSLNSYSGKTTIWEVGSQTRITSNKVETPELDLGLDSSGNTRSVTADNSIIQDDILKGGTF